MSIAGSTNGEKTKAREMVPIPGPAAAPMQEGKYGKNLASKHPEWGLGEIGDQIYQVAMAILGDIGNDTSGEKSIVDEPQRRNLDH